MRAEKIGTGKQLTIGGALAAGTTLAHAENPTVGGAAMYPDENIVENAVNSKDHTTLVAAVKAAGLVETLEGQGPFTAFAPSVGTTIAISWSCLRAITPFSYEGIVGLSQHRLARANRLGAAVDVQRQGCGCTWLKWRNTEGNRGNIRAPIELAMSNQDVN